MLKINMVKRHQKKAQHIVELALMMPIFIILFSVIFQIMVVTFSKYRFSYIFSSVVSNIVERQPIFTNLEDARQFNIREELDNALRGAMINASRVPFTDVNVSMIETENTSFVLGSFRYAARMLFLSNAANGYFYYAIPVSKAFMEPVVLNKTTQNLENFFASYYTDFAAAHFDNGLFGQGALFQRMETMNLKRNEDEGVQGALSE